ncbi:Protein detoxification 51 [Vitis vinifera]|uniref:Protein DETOXIFICATION n=1 Tax=Vitis vinifera TaxID=29760 RepID=A0A438GWQ1_VITVI|nr:Protein detoxification 51 [Vitis vinifera]
MCQPPSSPLSPKCNSNHGYPQKMKEPEPHMGTPLIPKSPTSNQQQYTQTHLSLAIREANSIAKIALPMILTGLLLYSRSMISMLFLGRLGELALAGGSLAVGFANITGYSILSGLAMGMEPICGQAFGAKRHALLGLSLQRTVLLLLFTSLPIAFLWLNMKRILLFCGQDEDIAAEAQSYLLYSLPDLFAQSLLHPLRIYLRTQSITLPLTFCATMSIFLHIPINYLLVSILNLGIKGVALSGVWTNFNLSNRCFNGDSDSNHFTHLHISIFSELQRIHKGRQRAGSQPAKQSQVCRHYRPGLQLHTWVSALLFAVMVRNVWASMFTQDAEIIALTSMVLPIIGLCELGNCPQTTGCGVLRGTARPRVGANINLGCFYLVGTPVAVGLGFYAGFDFEGLWLGLLAAQASCVVTMLVVLNRTDWEVEAQRAKQLTSGPLVPDEEDDLLIKPEIKVNSYSLAGDLDAPHSPV